MAIDKAASALVHGNFRQAARETYDFAQETAQKSFTPPVTHGLAMRALKAVDTLAHGVAAAAAVVPFVRAASDLGLFAYGVVKYVAGKAGQSAFGKESAFYDVKNSGRLSMSAATLSLLARPLGLVPGVGTLASAGISAASHGAATFVSAKHFVSKA